MARFKRQQAEREDDKTDRVSAPRVMLASDASAASNLRSFLLILSEWSANDAIAQRYADAETKAEAAT